MKLEHEEDLLATPKAARGPNMVYQHPNVLNEYIKCVIIGDSGVGKTCLVSSWACDTRYHLKGLLKTHQSTVWATDHYRNDRWILDRSVTEVDGVQVSLRLWDTFGYHDKDRGFAYRGTDVVLLCFSVVEPRSLKNLRKIWIPEIKRRVPTTPVVVVGCQADLRYMYMDEEFIRLDKGLMYKVTQAKDIVRPEEGRNVARMIGAPYYECSILTKYGVEDVFVNVIRAAMVEKRKLRFWSPQLRRIQFPQIQTPMKLPVPELPSMSVPTATLNDDLCKLLYDQTIGDVVFVVHSRCFRAHKIGLVVAAKIFEDLFLSEIRTEVVIEHHLSDSCSHDDMTSDEKMLLESEELPGVTPDPRVTCTDPVDQDNQPPPALVSSHPAFTSLEEQKSCDNPFQPGTLIQQTVVTLNCDITPRAFQYVLEYLYTGSAREDFDCLDEAKVAASLLQLSDLVLCIMNIQSGESFLNAELETRFTESRKQKLKEIALQQERLIDIQFKVDNGLVVAHKPLLMARCEMMYAMFSDNFLEASAHEIPFPGINMETFLALRDYLYTEELSAGSVSNCLEIIEIGNRLCLSRLVKLMEASVVQELTTADQNGEDIIEDVLLLLEPAQLYNADQLAAWCLQYLCNHYLPLRQRYMKSFQRLQKDNIEHIETHRWPPEWYIQEMKHYDDARTNSNKARKLKDGTIQQKHQFSRLDQCTNGCLCFCRRSKVVLDDVDAAEMPS